MAEIQDSWRLSYSLSLLLRHSKSFSSNSQASGRSLMTKGISCTAEKQHITPESTIDCKTPFGEAISEAGSQHQDDNRQTHYPLYIPLAPQAYNPEP